MSNNGSAVPNNRVAQASGMVSVQAHCTPDEALVLMQTRADELHHTMAEVAVGIIDHSIRFD